MILTLIGELIVALTGVMVGFDFKMRTEVCMILAIITLEVTVPVLYAKDVIAGVMIDVSVATMLALNSVSMLGSSEEAL